MNRARADTLHNRLVDRASADGWQRTGWRSAVRRLLSETPWAGDGCDDPEAVSELFDELFGGFTVVPDAWRVRIEKEGEGEGWLHPVLAIEFLEVEVTSSVSVEKLRLYDMLWWRLDATEMFFLRVFRMDQFGLVFPLVTQETIYPILNYLYGPDSPRCD